MSQFRYEPRVYTNQFSTKELSNKTQTDKSSTLKQFALLTNSVEQAERVTVADVQKSLHATDLEDLR